MKKTISARDFDARFMREMTAKYDSLAVGEDGGIAPKGVYRWLLDPPAAMVNAWDMAIAYHVSGEEKFREMADSLLDYLERSLIRQDGYIYWAVPFPPSLCQQGRWSREALRAAQITGNKKALGWLSEMFNAWPYDKQRHRFVERFMPGVHLPTSVNGFLTTYNMISDGTVNAWILAKETGNEELLEKARDTICNFVLPGQLENGLWNYHAPREVDMGDLNDGEEEYNYNLYLLYILSHLLYDEEARALIQEPIRRSFDELYRRFNYGDGSMYAPVHWGIDHIWEGAIYAAVISWRLFHFCGLAEYEDRAAKAMHWMLEADIGTGRHGSPNSSIGLYWGSYFLDMYGEDFCVTGDVADRADIIKTLEFVESKLSIVRPDAIHNGIFFGTSQHKTVYAMQRKIMRMKKENPEADTTAIAIYPQKTELLMPWQYPDTGYAAQAEISYDADALYLTVQTDCKKYRQDYTGASLFAGDGVLIECKTPSGEVCRLSLAKEGDKPVLFRYNNRIGFRADLRLFKMDIPRGWYLDNSTLSMTMTDEGLRYEAKILWSELGISPKQGENWDAGIAVIKEAPYGPQFNQWGRTSMEDCNNAYTGEWTF
ncbi:MAG: hypothetical protein IIY04_03935 [Oscillospiraceae bacterium]|nr:hypothetical protein [Oscillospiraceae bacterium]